MHKKMTSSVSNARKGQGQMVPSLKTNNRSEAEISSKQEVNKEASFVGEV